MAGRLLSISVVGVVLLCGCGNAKPDSIGGLSGPSPPGVSPDAGGTSNPCDGLRPGPPGQPVTVKVPLNGRFSALSPLADGQGNVVTGTAGASNIYAADGGFLGRASFLAFQPNGFGLTVPLASGFAGAILAVNGPALVRVTPGGGVQDIAALNDFVALTTADPRGGLVLFTPTALTAYDDEMRSRFMLPLQLPGVQPGQLGVDVAGNTLILFGANAFVYDLNGIWVDAAGNPGMAFPVAQQLRIDENVFSLAPDVQGGLFLWHQVCPGGGSHCTSEWERYAALSSSPEPAPDWLSSRPAPNLRLIHGQSGYALTGAPLPACAFEVLTATGMSCGFADFAPQLASSDASAPHFTANATGGRPPCHAALDIGRDGTVLSLTDEGCNAQGECPVSYDWFPAYFR